MRVAIIGHTGQDGQILWDQLFQDGHTLAGVSKTSSQAPPQMDCPSPPSIEDANAWKSWIKEFQPDEIYYLAAFHSSAESSPASTSSEELEQSTRVHVTGINNILEAVLQSKRDCRVFYASSSFVFGQPQAPVQTETAPMCPTDTYGITKLKGMRVCEEYREKHDLFVSVGILFNHESSLRGPAYLSQKVIQAALRISKGSTEKLVLGDLNSIVDWGYAPDFTRAFQLILRAPEPDNFIIATGERHTVADLVDIVFSHLGLNWEEHVEEDPTILIRPGVTRIGDYSHLKEVTGWAPSCDFETRIQRIVEETPGFADEP